MTFTMDNVGRFLRVFDILRYRARCIAIFSRPPTILILGSTAFNGIIVESVATQ